MYIHIIEHTDKHIHIKEHIQIHIIEHTDKHMHITEHSDIHVYILKSTQT